ncbi:MAG TPA: PstS family phosphate ABC transporter substrate-binding protein [Acidimicrobiales bacterium]|nr:PstS family phosphate ABC transporter substrate-binding protein [Acidimicrobiales bacterium]
MRYIKHRRSAVVPAVAVALLLVTAACGSDTDDDATGVPAASTGDTAGLTSLKGTIRMDGSSTVAPVMKVAAEDFQTATKNGVAVTVGVSGTGGGFEKFCRGETDISNASRKIKAGTADKPGEKEACTTGGVQYAELQVANDALSVIVNPDNTWAKCLTVDHLKKVWRADAPVGNWKDVDPSFPDKPIKRFGAGTDSGTFDYFTEAVNGKSGVITKDYNPSEDDNVTITGVSGDDGAVGFLGLSYALENKGKVTAVQIDGGKGCVTPEAKTVQDGTYAPLGRPLFVYVSTKAAIRPEVKAFVNYYFDNVDTITKEALFVALTAEQKQKALDAAKAAGI